MTELFERHSNEMTERLLRHRKGPYMSAPTPSDHSDYYRRSQSRITVVHYRADLP
jgi:hypothetical protein